MTSPTTPFRLRPGHLLASTALALALGVGLGCGRPPRPVARVGDQWIGQPEWADYLRQVPAGSSQKALDGLVRREVAWILAGRQCLLATPEWEKFSRKSQAAILAQAYLDAQPGGPAATEQQAHDFYFSHGEERHVKHLLLPSKEAADAALNRLRRGEPLAALADKVSKDPSVVKNHGDLGWIKREGLMTELAQPVFSTEAGKFCGPIQTQYGWHLLQVAEMKLPTEEGFAQNRDQALKQIQDMVAAMKKPAVTKALRAKYPLRSDRDVLGRDRTTEIMSGDEKLVAGKVADSTISLKELKGFLAETMGVAGAAHSLGPDTKISFMEMMADDIRMAAAAVKDGIAKSPAVKAAIWDAQRAAALEQFSRTYLVSYKVTDAELQAHYDAFPDRFAGVGSVKVNLLVADQARDAEKALQKAQKGVPWKTLVAKHGNPASTGNWDPGFLEVAQLTKILSPEAVKALTKAPLGALVGPVPGPDGSMLFKILDRKAGERLPLPECLDAVRADFLKEHGRERVESYLDTEGRKGIRIEEMPENAAKP